MSTLGIAHGCPNKRVWLLLNELSYSTAGLDSRNFNTSRKRKKRKGKEILNRSRAL